jgi:hypothetical protein
VRLQPLGHLSGEVAAMGSRTPGGSRGCRLTPGSVPAYFLDSILWPDRLEPQLLMDYLQRAYATVRTSCRLRLMACRARGSGRQRATPTPSERGFSSRAITRTAITYSLHVMAGFTNFRVLVIQSAFESIHTSRLIRTNPFQGRSLSQPSTKIA